MQPSTRREERLRDLPDVWVREPSTVPEGASISEAVRLLVERPESRMVYVLDAERRLRGVVSFRCVLRVAKARLGVRDPGVLSALALFRNLLPEKAEDIMREPSPVRADDTLAHALLVMASTQQNDLPIVDEQGRLVGELNGIHVMRVALDVLRRTEDDLKRARDRQPSL